MSKLDAYKKEARRAEDREDFDQAIQLYRRAVSEAREDPSATFEVGLYNRIGDLYLKLDETTQAVHHYLLAIDRYADDELYPPAIALCRKVLRVSPDEVKVYRQLARLHGATGLMADARDEMDRYLAGVWETGDVNGAMDGLPELVDGLMSGRADLEEVRRLNEQGEAEEAFELLYRQWEDDSDDWENGNGKAATSEREEPSRSDADDSGLGASLRRGWQGLFGGAEEEDEGAGDELELVDLEETGDDEPSTEPAAEAADRAAAEVDEEPASGLEEVDDLAWLREVTAPSLRAPEPEPKAEAEVEAEADEAAEEAVEEPDVAAGADEVDSSVLDIVAAATGQPIASDDEADDAVEPAPRVEAETAAEDDGQDAAAPEVAASADAREDSSDAREDVEEVDEVEVPAGPPAEVLAAAAESLARGTTARPALTGGVAAPMLLSAAQPGVSEGRAVVAERPVDRAVRARIRRGDRVAAAAGRPPEGPAFETPGREDYLPAGAEVAARSPSPRTEWLSDQVARLGAMARNEPLAVQPAFGPPLDVLLSAAEALDRAATVEPVAAIPAEVEAPDFVDAAVVEDDVAVVEDDAAVVEEARAPEPVVQAEPETSFERPPPEGPEFETPGRDDYLPAGDEVEGELPSPALAWLAASVADIHRLDWGQPAWFDATSSDRGEGAAADDAGIRIDRLDPSEEAAARATREALALLAAGEIAAEPEPDAAEADAAEAEEAADEVEAAAEPATAIDEAEAAATVEEAPEATEAAEDVGEADEEPAAELAADEVEAGKDDDVVQAATAAYEKKVSAAADTDAAVDEPAVGEDEAPEDEPAAASAESQEADEEVVEDAAEPAAAGAEEVVEAEPEAPAVRQPATEPATGEPSNGVPTVSPPVQQPASRPMGLDFTALLKQIGWLRSQQDPRPDGNGAAAATDTNGVQSGTDDAVMPSWSGRSSSGTTGTDGKSEPDGEASVNVRPPTADAPGSGVPNFTDLLEKVGWLREDERT